MTVQGIPVFAAKQYVGFPGNLFAFAAAALLDALIRREPGFLFVKVFLVFYAAVLVPSLLFLTRRYLRRLSSVPAHAEPGRGPITQQSASN